MLLGLYSEQEQKEFLFGTYDIKLSNRIKGEKEKQNM